MLLSRWSAIITFALGCALSSSVAGSTCVWRVSSPTGGTLYLGGSIHALTSADYPLPAAYNRAFDASARLAFEDDPDDWQDAARLFARTMEYPKGDNLKKHVDPRTYDYVRRVFKLMGVPEERFFRFRAWALVIFLQSPSLHGLSQDLGVEGFLEKRARANSKSISGLESVKEHLQVFSGLTERQSEALLLITFIPTEQSKRGSSWTLDLWRRGDAETLAREVRQAYREFPAMGERLLGARNRRWIPKIEGYLRSGKTYFVVVGAGHMGGSDGLLALLKSRGYKIEQL